MPKMYYFNGVELPALPEYDTAKYPYAWITEYRNPQTDKTIYYIFNVASEVYPHKFEISSYGGWLSAYTPDGIKGDKLQYDPAKHDDWYTTGEFLKFPDGFNGMLVAEGGHIEPLDEWLKEYIPIWSNFDILDTDGSVYFAKCDDPVPVEDEDDGVQLYSWLIGFLISLIQKPTLTFDAPPAQDPVAYLYNGVRLPKLPEWDREKYPYAYIGSTSVDYNTSTMKIRFCDKPLVYNADNRRTELTDYTYYVDYFVASGDLEWSGMNVGSNYRPGAASGIWGSAVWSNVDFYDVSGNLILSASEPIPVYE